MKAITYCVEFSCHVCAGMVLAVGSRLVMLTRTGTNVLCLLLTETQAEEVSVWINRSRLNMQAVKDKKMS